MPSRPWPLWCLTGLVLLAFPPLNFVYWPQVLRSGVLPPDGDSIFIPMLGSIYVTLLLSPLILGVAWLCLRRYNPKTSIAAWRRDRPYRSAVVTLLFGPAAALMTAAAVQGVLTPAMPWYEYLWAAYFALWGLWLLYLRAAAIDQLDSDGCY